MKWQEIATCDIDTIRMWWRYFPKSNVGVLMGGLTNTIAVDIDGIEGKESLAKLEELHGPLPITRAQSTGREHGGTHYFFEVQAPLDCDWVRNRAHLAPGIDLRASGGFVVGTPSMHASGARYRWLNDAPIAPLPKWMFTLAISHREQLKHFTSSGECPTEDQFIEMGKPLKLRLAHAKKALTAEPPAIQGQNGSATCLHAAILMVRGYGLPGPIAFDLLWRDYNSKCQPPWSHDELLHKVNSATSPAIDVTWGYHLAAVLDAAQIFGVAPARDLFREDVVEAVDEIDAVAISAVTIAKPIPPKAVVVKRERPRPPATVIPPTVPLATRVQRAVSGSEAAAKAQLKFEQRRARELRKNKRAVKLKGTG